MHLPLTGTRLWLRDWRPADLDPFARWSQPGQHWQAFDGPYYPRPTTAQVAEEVLQIAETMRTGAWSSPRRRLVIAEQTDDTLLGMVSWYWVSQETNWLAVGIVLYDPATWHRGYGFKALGLWCDYLWTMLPDLLQLDLCTWSGNHRACNTECV